MLRKFKHGTDREAYEYRGEVYTMSELHKLLEFDLTLASLSYRIKRLGWTVEKAMTCRRGHGHDPAASRPKYEYGGVMYSATELYRLGRCSIGFSGFLRELKSGTPVGEVLRKNCRPELIK